MRRGGSAVLREPLAADVLHHRVLRSFSRLQDVLHQRARPARVQLHGQQVRRPQFTAHQEGFDLRQKVSDACYKSEQIFLLFFLHGSS